MDGFGAQGWLGFVFLIGILMCVLLIGAGLAIYYCSVQRSRLAKVLMQLGALAAIASILAANLVLLLITGDPKYAWGLIWLVFICVMVDVLYYAYKKRKDK